MPTLPTDQILTPRVVVIASSIEGIDALARLINQLPRSFPIPVVVQVHGLKNQSLTRLTGNKWQFTSRLKVVYAQAGDRIDTGCVYVIPNEEGLVFTALFVLDHAAGVLKSNVDDLFKSASLWYGCGVIGVVLCGLGADGTIGLQAVANAHGIRVVQSPAESSFSNMSSSALLGGHVQYSVMLDELGPLLEALVLHPEPSETISEEMEKEIRRLMSSSDLGRNKSLDRSIVDILAVMRVELAIDITFVSRETSDAMAVLARAESVIKAGLQKPFHSKNQTFNQCVLDSRMTSIPDNVSVHHRIHALPADQANLGPYLAASIWLRSGTFYGTLVCVNFNASKKSGRQHLQRLELSARQIARLVNEAGEK